MVWIGGPRRDPGDRLGRGRRGLYLHDPPPGYHPPQPRMTLKDRQRIARQDWILEHVLAVILILSATAVIVIICLIIATHLLARMSQHGRLVPCLPDAITER
jgi:hypothetical protein